MTRFSPIKSIVMLMMFGLFVSIGSFACTPPANNEQTNSDASTADTGDTTDKGGDTTLSYAKDIWPLFDKAGCKNCHGKSGGLAIDGPDALDKILEKKGASGKIAVKAGDPAASYLLEKIKPNPSSGKIMPPNGTPLTDDEVKKVEDWIKQGAKP